MADVRFSITAADGYSRVALGTEPIAGRQLNLTNPNDNDPDQQWTWVFMPALQASALFNPYRNLFAAPKAIAAGAPIIAFSSEMAFTAGATWIMASTPPTTIAPRANPDLIMLPIGGMYGGALLGLGDVGQAFGDWTTSIIYT